MALWKSMSDCNLWKTSAKFFKSGNPVRLLDHAHFCCQLSALWFFQALYPLHCGCYHCVLFVSSVHQYGIANEDTEAVCEKLKKDLKTVFNVLPKDMQQLLIMNPERASLLQESHECSDLPKHTLLPDGVVSSAQPR
ncbi:UNVERIFIED_CONTAM: hypothetical protein Sradi_0140800 [Sesamum radiatum]|uniref:Uncharacterized protein n=1 Tax=Sesamum radiatum TaxID=300843 RepID=A0AAW2WLU3_SESRA